MFNSKSNILDTFLKNSAIDKIIANVGKIDVAKLGSDLADTLLSGLNGVLEGAASDLKTFATAIAADMVRALSEPDKTKREAKTKELLNQIRVVGEINRIRLTNATWDTIDSIVLMLTNAALSALGAAIPKPA